MEWQELTFQNPHQFYKLLPNQPSYHGIYVKAYRNQGRVCFDPTKLDGWFRVAKPASCSQFTHTSLVSHTRWCFLQGLPGPEQHLLLISSTTFFGLKEGHCLVILWIFSLAYSLTRWKNQGQLIEIRASERRGILQPSGEGGSS